MGKRGWWRPLQPEESAGERQRKRVRAGVGMATYCQGV